MDVDMARTWDAQAARFDEEPDHGLGDPAVRRAWGELLLEHVPAGSTVLDLGCGTGSLAVLLAEQGHCVVGIDLSPRMVDAARIKAAAHDTAVTFLVGDAADPPVEGPFDVVLARHVVWALPDPSRALGRWKSLLAEQGRLVLVEGLWGTGAGLSAATLQTLVAPEMDHVAVRQLPERALWGRPITDERYVLTARL